MDLECFYPPTHEIHPQHNILPRQNPGEQKIDRHIFQQVSLRPCRYAARNRCRKSGHVCLDTSGIRFSRGPCRDRQKSDPGDNQQPPSAGATDMKENPGTQDRNRTSRYLPRLRREPASHRKRLHPELPRWSGPLSACSLFWTSTAPRFSLFTPTHSRLAPAGEHVNGMPKGDNSRITFQPERPTV